MKKGRWAVAAGIYVVLAAAILSRFWTVSASPFADAFNYFYPAFAYLSGALREGRLPLWDPYTNCGLPYHADPQAATLNPIALVLGLAVPRPALGFVLFWVLHWIAAGLGMFLVVRALRGTPGGGVVAALAYAFSGFFVGNAQHTSWIVTAAWLPWAIGLAHLAVATGRAGFALLAGAAMALSSLGGYPVLVAVGVYYLALWLAAAFLGPWARFEGPRPSVLRCASRVGATLAVVTATLLVVWSPVLNAFLFEAREYTDRTAPIGPGTWLNPFTVRAAISLLFPYAIVPARPWIPSDISMNDGYLGLLSLPLAWVAFTRRRCGGRPTWLLVIAILMFAVSLSARGSVSSILAALVPPMKFMRHPGGYRVFWILPLAAAAGIGASLVLASARARSRLRTGFAAVAALALLAGAMLALVLRLLHVELSPVLLIKLYLPTVVVLAAGAFLLRTSWRPRQGSLVTAGLLAVLVVDLAAHVHFSETVASRRKWIREAERLPRTLEPVPKRQAGSPHDSFNAQQVTRAPVARGYTPMQRAGFNDALARGPFLDVLLAHRYWLSGGSSLARDEAAEVAMLAARGAHDPIPIFVERADATLPGEPAVPGAYGGVRIAAYGPERVELAVHAPGPGAAILASTERFAPGWRVAIDGKPAATLRVNYFFRGVLVPSGAHVVAWTYEPARFVPLAGVAAAALVAAILSGSLLLLRRSDRPIRCPHEEAPGCPERRTSICS